MYFLGHLFRSRSASSREINLGEFIGFLVTVSSFMLLLHYSRRRQDDSEVTLSTVILFVFRRERRDYVRAL